MQRTLGAQTGYIKITLLLQLCQPATVGGSWLRLRLTWSPKYHLHHMTI